MAEPDIRVELATEEAVIDGHPTRLWCSELYVNGRFDHATPWKTSVVDAIRDGRELLASARSDWAYKEARLEAHALFTPAA